MEAGRRHGQGRQAGVVEQEKPGRQFFETSLISDQLKIRLRKKGISGGPLETAGRAFFEQHALRLSLCFKKQYTRKLIFIQDRFPIAVDFHFVLTNSPYGVLAMLMDNPDSKLSSDTLLA